MCVRNFFKKPRFDDLEQLPVIQTRGMPFTQDDASPHFMFVMPNYLNNQFPRSWIGRAN